MDEEEGERMEERGIDGERVVEMREREGEALTDRGEAEGETEDHDTSEQGPDAEGELFNLLCVYISIYIYNHTCTCAFLSISTCTFILYIFAGTLQPGMRHLPGAIILWSHLLHSATMIVQI